MGALPEGGRMPKRRRKAIRGRGGSDGALSDFRQHVQAANQRLHRVGRQRISAIDKQIKTLSTQRQALLDELGAVMRGVGEVGGRRRSSARRPATRGRTRPRRRRRARVDWTKVYARLPRGSFRASDVRRLVPGVTGKTLSRRLTGWVKAKKLRRKGRTRSMRYTKAA